MKDLLENMNVSQMEEYLVKMMKQKGHFSHKDQIKYLKKFKDHVLGDSPKANKSREAVDSLLKNSQRELSIKVSSIKESNQNTIIMSHEFLRMQKLSGVITEGEYNQKTEELNSAESSTETLNENVVGIGATLNPYPTKKKEVYESAFSKFLGEEKEDELEENARTDAEEEGYKDGMKDEKADLGENERTDTEEEGYKDGFKDAIKDAKDAISKLRKELKEEDELEEEDLYEDARTDAEEEGYQDGFKDAIKDALDALKGIKGELKEEDDMDEAMSNPDQRHKDDKGPDRGAERKSLDSEPRYNKKDTE